MTRVLVTGGSGVLGSKVVTRLKKAGYTPRIVSRRSQPATLSAGVEWAQADVGTGEGLGAAVKEVDVIVHAATSPFRRGRQVEVEGTRHVLEQARLANVSHVIYISIVGIERVPFFYYRYKLAAEDVITSSSAPWSILRATQFHDLIDMMLQPVAKFPFGLLPMEAQFQPVDSGEVADRIVEMVAAGPAGRVPDMGGPEVHRLGDMARIWMETRGLRRRIFNLARLGKAGDAIRRGYLTCPDNRQGKVTWAAWVQEKYATADNRRLASV